MILPDWFQRPVAIHTAKLLGNLIRVTGQGSGTSLPGKVGLKLDPNLLKKLAAQLNKTRLAISGTNGKSTTAGVLASLCKADGFNTVHNALGANMKPGLTASLIEATSLAGQLNADVGIFEVDEASLPQCALEIRQDWTLVTNLFRDQLDRYGELDTTAKLIEQGIANSGGGMILNADDPMVSAMALHLKQPAKTTGGSGFHRPVIYYGVSSVDYPDLPPLDSPVAFPREVTDCPLCQAPLHYDLFTYGHLGHYHCTACDFARPDPHVQGHIVMAADHSILKIHCNLNHTPYEATFPINMPGLYNSINVLAALCAALTIGIQPAALNVGLDRYRGLFGRAEHQLVDGKPVTMMLIKNPIGAWEVLKVAAGLPKARLLIVINDDYADGRDISWLWDAPFEYLVNHPTPITVSGKRAEDMALRLAYAGVPESRLHVEHDIMGAFHGCLNQLDGDEQLVVLPTYTALLAMSLALKTR
ncbi:MAG: DUF1727 domain-containing protein [Cyanobacteria bacterium HKST-UBA06]|nr:DUF1727 domain-containing protein [Cyanobacteria bacterium HKST-UBA06]